MVKPRQATGFSLYVKAHFARVKAAMVDCGEAQGTKDVMRELAAQYKACKATSAVADAPVCTSVGGSVWLQNEECHQRQHEFMEISSDSEEEEEIEEEGLVRIR